MNDPTTTPDNFLDDLPVGEDAGASGLPSFVQGDPVGDPSGLDDSDLGESEATETAEDAQTTQDTKSDEEAVQPSSESPSDETVAEPSETENAAPAAASKPEPTPEPPAPLKVQEHPPASPSVMPPAAVAHPKVDADNAIKDIPTKEAAKFVPVPTSPLRGLGDVQPEPGDVVGKPLPVPSAPRTLKPKEKVTIEVARQWDKMMGELSAPTRTMIWEIGLSNLQELLTTPTVDLVKPRGKLVAGQVVEIENWLKKNLNFKLPMSRREVTSSYVPQAPIKIGDQTPHREMTHQLAAQRKQRLDGMRGDRSRR